MIKYFCRNFFYLQLLAWIYRKQFLRPRQNVLTKTQNNFAPRSLQVIQKLWIFIIDLFSSNFTSRKVEHSFSNCAEGSLSKQENVCSKTDFFRQNPNMKEKLSFLSFFFLIISSKSAMKT